VIVFALSALACLVALATFAEIAWGARRLKRLEDAPSPTGSLPRVSIVFAARDEERGIEAAARSHLAQDYPDFEVVAVDDRSTDRTGEILGQVAAGADALTVIRIESLPPRWLGKCHALSRGVRAATGEWVLFTDADVVLDPSALSRAVGLAESEGLDHLTVVPHARMPGFLQAFGAAFAMFMSFYLRPWRIPDPKSRAYAGIGAFNLVRKSAYHAAGGHEAIRLAVDDDRRLGKVLKRSGARSALALGSGLVTVDWYPDFPSAIRGLEKGLFGGLHYSLIRVAAVFGGQALLFLWPVAGLFFGGWVALLNAVTCLIFGALYLGYARDQRAPLWSVVLLPAWSAIFQWILLRSAFRTLLQGGVVWRGTFYPLSDLRDA